MGLLLWGCKLTATEGEICTFSKSNKTILAFVQADTRGTNALQPTKTWYALSPETYPDDAGSDMPSDDDAPTAGKALNPHWPSLSPSCPRKMTLGWRYGLTYQPPVRAGVTLPPPQAWV